MPFFHSNSVCPTEEEAARLQADKGVKRLLRILDRDTGRFLRSGLMTLAAFLPMLLGSGLCILRGRGAAFIAVLVLTGPLCEAALCALYDTILRSLRGETGFWWLAYRKAWKDNARGAVVPGLVFGMAFGVLGCAAGKLLQTSPVRWSVAGVLLVILLLLTGLHTLTLAQLVLIELPLDQVLRNSLLLTVPFFLRVMLSSVLQVGFWMVILLFFPFSLVLVPLLGFWFAALAGLWYGIYQKPINTVFRIEERLEDKHS